MSNAPTHSVHSAIATGPLLLLLFLLISCLAPRPALAIDGYDQLGFRTISDDCGPFFIGKYEAQDASIAYCMNQERPGPTKPGGPWLNFDQGWVWLDDEFAAIVCHGYPSATSFGGYSLSPDRARAATQLAVWMLNGTTHVDGTYSYTTAQGKTKSGHFTADNEVVAAARWLHDNAKSGGIKAAPHRARRYLGPISGGSKRQDMLYVLPAVSVSFQKKSANTVITSGNGTYQFDGATFDIFESVSDARVGTLKMDGNGRAQATLLPNTAYYLVETKAPAGYIPRRDRIPFTTEGNGGHVTIDEQPGTITLRIVKTDAATGAGAQAGTSLAGAEFTCVSQSTPGWTQTLTTDENGRAALDNVPLGTFTIYESKAPEGYLLPSDSWTYTVGADQLGDSGVVELESRVSDIPITFDLEISKFKDHGNSDQSGLEQPAEGVVFEVISNSSQQVVGTLTTNIYMVLPPPKTSPEHGSARASGPTAPTEPSPTTVPAIHFGRSQNPSPKALNRQENGPSRLNRLPTVPSFSTSWTTMPYRHISRLLSATPKPVPRFPLQALASSCSAATTSPSRKRAGIRPTMS